MTGWLVDTSAYASMQSGQAANIAEWNSRIERGLVRLLALTRLELGYSARSGKDGRESSRRVSAALSSSDHVVTVVFLAAHCPADVRPQVRACHAECNHDDFARDS